MPSSRESLHVQVVLLFSFLCHFSSCVKYVQEPENTTLLTVALKIHKKFKQYPQALRLALMINDPVLIRQVFLECPDRLIQV